MLRDGAIIFRDIAGKLDALNTECDRCGRRGRYRLHRLIERYGIDAKVFEWSDEITADCRGSTPRICTTQVGAGAQSCQRWFEGPDLSRCRFLTAKGACVLIFGQEPLSHRRRRMFRGTLIAFAAAVMLATAFVSTEAWARYGGGYGRGGGQPPTHCKGYFYCLVGGICG